MQIHGLPVVVMKLEKDVSISLIFMLARVFIVDFVFLSVYPFSVIVGTVSNEKGLSTGQKIVIYGTCSIISPLKIIYQNNVNILFANFMEHSLGRYQSNQEKLLPWKLGKG